jgi:predicted dehydrogenase
MLKMSAETYPNFDPRSLCHLWSVNRERAADDATRLFGTRPKTYKYSEELLADPALDAVRVGTGDHQHARILKAQAPLRATRDGASEELAGAR